MSDIRGLFKKVDLNLMLKKFGGEYVAWLKELIQIADKIATGRLLNSIDYKIVKSTEKYLLEITAKDYLKYVDAGRKPNGKLPPVDLIIKWAKLKRLTLHNGQTYESVGWAIAKSIAKKGIQPTNILFQTRKGIMNKLKDMKIPEETKQQILNEITNALLTTDGKAIVTINKK